MEDVVENKFDASTLYHALEVNLLSQAEEEYANYAIELGEAVALANQMDIHLALPRCAIEVKETFVRFGWLERVRAWTM